MCLSGKTEESFCTVAWWYRLYNIHTHVSRGPTNEGEWKSATHKLMPSEKKICPAYSQYSTKKLNCVFVVLTLHSSWLRWLHCSLYVFFSCCLSLIRSVSLLSGPTIMSSECLRRIRLRFSVSLNSTFQDCWRELMISLYHIMHATV